MERDWGDYQNMKENEEDSSEVAQLWSWEVVLGTLDSRAKQAVTQTWTFVSVMTQSQWAGKWLKGQSQQFQFKGKRGSHHTENVTKGSRN